MSKWSPLWALPTAQRAPALLAARFTAPSMRSSVDGKFPAAQAFKKPATRR